MMSRQSLALQESWQCPLAKCGSFFGSLSAVVAVPRPQSLRASVAGVSPPPNVWIRRPKPSSGSWRQRVII